MRSNASQALTLSMAILFFPAAHAAKWFEVSVEDDPLGTTTLVDTASLVHDGDYREIWVMRTSPNEQTAQRTADGLCMSSKSLLSFSCKKRLWGLKYRVCYSKEYGEGESNVVASDMATNPNMPLIPNSVAENVAWFACARIAPAK